MLTRLRLPDSNLKSGMSQAQFCTPETLPRLDSSVFSKDAKPSFVSNAKQSEPGLCHDFRPLPSRSIAYSQILTRFLRSQAIEYKCFFRKVTQSRNNRLGTWAWR